MNALTIFLGLFVSISAANILYVRTFQELLWHFPSNSEASLPAGYIAVFLHVFLAAGDFESFSTRFPQFVHYQVVERFLYGIYVDPSQKSLLKFSKLPIVSFDDDDDESDNASIEEEGEANIEEEASVGAAKNSNQPACKVASLLDSSAVRPYSLADYYDLERFQREKEYQFEEILLTLCLHTSLLWNIPYCQHHKLIQSLFDSIDYKALKGLQKFFNINQYAQPNILMRNVLKKISESIFNDVSKTMIHRDTDDLGELFDKLKNLGALNLYTQERNSTGVIRFKGERFYFTGFQGITFWNILEQFKRETHARLITSAANFILEFCPQFERQVETAKLEKAIKSLAKTKDNFLDNILPTIKGNFEHQMANEKFIVFARCFVEVIVEFVFWKKSHFQIGLDHLAIQTMKSIYIDTLQQFNHKDEFVKLIGNDIQHPFFSHIMLMSRILNKCHKLVISTFEIDS